MSSDSDKYVVSSSFFDSFTFGCQTILLLESIHSLRYAPDGFRSIKKKYFYCLILASFFNWIHGIIGMGFFRWYDLFNAGLMAWCMLNISIFYILYYMAVLNRLGILKVSYPTVKYVIIFCWVLIIGSQIYNDSYWMLFGRNMELWARLEKGYPLTMLCAFTVDCLVIFFFVRGLYFKAETVHGRRQFSPMMWHFIITSIIVALLSITKFLVNLSKWSGSSAILENLVMSLKIRKNYLGYNY